MSRLTVALLSFLFLLPLSEANTRVGTGGEGTLVDNKIFVRDLYENDAHLNPWFGSVIDPRISIEIVDWNPLELNEVQKRLLVQKLSDANQSFPRLGSFLVLALRFYDWRYTDLELQLPAGGESRVEIPESARVAIANRYMHSIVVNRSYFESLDDKNKVALLIHEAIYSLVKARAQFPYWNQSVATTRMLTANLFSKEGVAFNMRHMAPLLMAVPELPLEEQGTDLCKNALISMTITDPSEKLIFANKSSFKAFDVAERRAFFERTFVEALEKRKSMDLPEVKSDSFKAMFFMRSALITRPVIYQANNGDQIQLTIEKMNAYLPVFEGQEFNLGRFNYAFDGYFKGISCR